VDLAGARVVAVLTRAPSAGGKTRLFEALGRPPDPALLTALLLDTLDGVRVRGVVCAISVEPPEACDEVRRLAPDVEVVSQTPGSLGVRMASAMRHFFDRGAAMVALVGSDLPDLQPRVVSDAFAALAADPSRLVLGPAADGGYYLIASTTVPPVFDGIEWGTAAVLEDTRAAAEGGGFPVHLLDPLDDVDVPGTLVRVTARRTAAWVAQHL
jgi:rSAM/selenodomain-associated transferase 1